MPESFLQRDLAGRSSLDLYDEDFIPELAEKYGAIAEFEVADVCLAKVASNRYILVKSCLVAEMRADALHSRCTPVCRIPHFTGKAHRDDCPGGLE